MRHATTGVSRERRRARRAGVVGLTMLLLAALTGCSLVGAGKDDSSGDGRDQGGGAESGPIVLLTHESFSLPKTLIRAFERDTGRTLTVRAAGDAGTLTTRLALSAGNPEGDVAFGVDNAFASRALEAGAFESAEVEQPPGAEQYALREGGDRLFPVDTGNVCVNVDDAWFDEHRMDPPRSLDDLVRPQYRDLFVTPGASSSSPGLAFLLGTVEKYGADWPRYWQRLMANGAKITDGWSVAYFEDFTTSGGDRPIVVSYDSSPAFTLSKDKRSSTTSALLDTCVRQVEYAGVLAGTDSPEGSRQLVQFLLSDEVQAALPESMYVFPVADDVALPKDWERFAQRPDDPTVPDPAEVEQHREHWLTEWTDVTTR